MGASGRITFRRDVPTELLKRCLFLDETPLNKLALFVSQERL